jgi:D-sedoheptulose 7-phosphate isomerase
MSRHDKQLRDLLRRMQEAQNEVPLEPLASAAELIARTIRSGKHVWIAGNGGSAATAAHLASDLINRATTIPRIPIHVECLSESSCLLTALVNDHGWEIVYQTQLLQRAAPDDIFIALSVLGGSRHRAELRQSLNLLLGLQAAHQRGCRTIGLIGADGGSFSEYCDIWIGTKHSDACIVEPLHSLIAHLLVELVVDDLREPTVEQRETLPAVISSVAQP